MTQPVHASEPRFLERRTGACAVIAIKARAQGKSRLARVLTPQARLQLVRSMLKSVLAAAQSAQTVRQVLVVSPERDEVPPQIAVLADAGDSLNGALVAARKALDASGCREMVVLPADLPDITAAEIDILVNAGRRGGFALAPDAAGSGTNALYLGSPPPFEFQFGFDSARLHLQEAQRLGLPAQVVHLPGLEFDVDSPHDLALIEEHTWRARIQA